jgi:hypothetical protein
MLFAYERPLCADIVEKLENGHTSKSPGNIIFGLSLPLEVSVGLVPAALVAFAGMDVVPHVVASRTHQRS